MVTSILAFAAVSRYGLVTAFGHGPSRVQGPVGGQAPVAGQATGAPTIQVPLTMTSPEAFVRAERMLRTPKIDGKIDADEWDVLFDNRLRMVPASAVPSTTAAAPTAAAVGGTPSGVPAAAGTGTPTTPATSPTTPGTPPTSPPAPTTPATQPATPAPGPGPLTGTPIRRTPNPDPKAKPPATPPPAQTAVVVAPPPAPVQVAPPPVVPMTPLGVLTAYLNWEPGKIYLAATYGAGQDLIISIDGKGDGFLVGRDNLELRITPGAVNTLKARVLDATNPAGPIWTDASGFVTASQVASSTTNGITTVEICLVDPGYGIVPGKLGDNFAVRFDAVSPSAPPTEPFVPRVTTPVKLVDQWTEGLPANFKLNVPAKGRGAFPSDSTTVHWQFTSAPGTTMKRLDITAEGWLNDFVNSLSVPSPEFDGKGNSTVDYETKVVKGAPVGYGVLKGILNGNGWGPATAEVSFRVPPPMDLDIPAKTVKFSETIQKLKAVVTIRSNSDRKIEGHLQVLPPAGWTVNAGSDKNFYIYDRKGAVLNGFELGIPGGVRGSFPVTLRVAAIGTITDQTFWVTIL